MKKHRKQRNDKGKPRKPYNLSLEIPPENVQSKTDTLKEEMRGKVPMGLTFEDLPKDRQDKVNQVIAWRRTLNLPDDSAERKNVRLNIMSLN